MRKSDYGMEILRIGNGYNLKFAGFNDETGEYAITPWTIQDSDDDKLKSGQELLEYVIEHFFLMGSKFDKERLCIRRERGSKYIRPRKKT